MSLQWASPAKRSTRLRAIMRSLRDAGRRSWSWITILILSCPSPIESWRWMAARRSPSGRRRKVIADAARQKRLYGRAHMNSTLVVEGLSGGYERIRVFRDVDLPRPRETVGILGPNGAGRTTLLLTLAGILPSLFGKD